MTEEQELRASFGQYLPPARRGLVFHFDPSSLTRLPSPVLRRYGPWGAAAAGLALAAVIVPMLLRQPPSSPTAQNPEKFVLPVKSPVQILMVSMTRGWVVPSSHDALYYTNDAGRHWSRVPVQVGYVVPNRAGQSVWSFQSMHTSRQYLVKEVTHTGHVRQYTVSVPGTRTVASGTTSEDGMGGLVIGAYNLQAQNRIIDEVVTFGPDPRGARVLYRSSKTGQAPVLTALTVESANRAWVVSNSPGPGHAALWKISATGGKPATLTPVSLPLPTPMKTQRNGLATPAPIAGPQLFSGKDTGFLGTTYQSLSLKTLQNVSDAILYREIGGKWTPIWHKPGKLYYAKFVSPLVGWVEYLPTNGSGPKLLRTTDGGKSFHQIATPDTGQPFPDFVNAKDGWWLDGGSPATATQSASPAQVWVTHNGGQTWTAMRTVTATASSPSP